MQKGKEDHSTDDLQDLTKQENMLHFVCTETTESKPVKQWYNDNSSYAECSLEREREKGWSLNERVIILDQYGISDARIRFIKSRRNLSWIKATIWRQFWQHHNHDLNLMSDFWPSAYIRYKFKSCIKDSLIG